MITVWVNGEERQVPEGTTVEALLSLLEIKRTRIAVEWNRSIVPRTRYTETIIEEGDKLEIVTLVGGG